LELTLREIDVEHVQLLSSFVAPTLSVLRLIFLNRYQSIFYYEILEAFLSNCLAIRYLELRYFKFDVDLVDDLIVDGINRLKQLDLIHCYGKVVECVVLIQPCDLKSFSYVSKFDTQRSNAYGTIATITKNSPLLTLIRIEAPFESSTILQTVVNDCPKLERISFNPRGPIMEPAVIDAISSLPNLKYLDIGKIDDGAVASLLKCTSLNHLQINGRVKIDLLLQKIGKNLVSLSLKDMSKKKVDIRVRLIIECCPNLESLSLRFRVCYDLVSEDVVEEVKKGLKRLSKFQINGNAVRLGTDWTGWF
jgi:hypothetical protein